MDQTRLAKVCRGIPISNLADFDWYLGTQMELKYVNNFDRDDIAESQKLIEAAFGDIAASAKTDSRFQNVTGKTTFRYLKI